MCMFSLFGVCRYHVGSLYQPYHAGYARRLKVMALNFCSGQLTTPHEVKYLSNNVFGIRRRRPSLWHSARPMPVRC